MMIPLPINGKGNIDYRYVGGLPREDFDSAGPAAYIPDLTTASGKRHALRSASIGLGSRGSGRWKPTHAIALGFWAFTPAPAF